MGGAFAEIRLANDAQQQARVRLLLGEVGNKKGPPRGAQ